MVRTFQTVMKNCASLSSNMYNYCWFWGHQKGTVWDIKWHINQDKSNFYHYQSHGIAGNSMNVMKKPSSNLIKICLQTFCESSHVLSVQKLCLWNMNYVNMCYFYFQVWFFSLWLFMKVSLYLMYFMWHKKSVDLPFVINSWY